VADPAALHLRHDTIAVAAAADRGGQLAAEHVACPHCVRLYEDLVLLTALAPTSAVPPRTRDFRLSAADAAHLREQSWTGWWRVIGSSRDRVTRPVALALTTLGLAGIVLTSVPALVPSLGAAADREMIDIEDGEDTGTGLASGDPSTTNPVDPPVAPPDEGLPVLALSASFVAAGGALLAVRWTVRRSAGPA